MIRKANLNDLDAIEMLTTNIFNMKLIIRRIQYLKKAFILQERMPSVL